MSNAQTANFSDAIKTLYEKRLLTRAQPRLVHPRWAVPARFVGFGSYEIRKYGSLAAVTSTLSEGVTPDEHDAPSLSTVTITPSWYGAWIGFTDKLDVTNFDPIVSEISAILGEQAGLSVDTLVRNAMVSGATARYSGSAAATTDIDTTNDLIDYASFVKAVAALEANNALPVDGDDFIVIIHPHSWANLMRDTTFVALFTREGGESVRSGYVGRILRCKIFISSNAYENADAGDAGTVDVYSMLFIARESYAVAGFAGLMPDLMMDGGGDGVGPLTGQTVKPVEIIMKGLGSSGIHDPLDQRGTVGWKATHEEAILNSAWILDLQHANDFSAT